MENYIDADNTVAGRLASQAAKKLLKGERVSIVNAEKAVLSGTPTELIKSYTEKRERGDPYHGPFYPREPDRLLRRIIRGMLPHKRGRGREALKRLRVYISVPEELKNKKFTKISGTENTLKCKSMTIGALAEKLGAKKTW